MQDKLIDIKNEALAQIMSCRDLKELEAIRIDYLGKAKGKVTLIMKKIPQMAPLEKAAVGRLANEVKKQIEEALQRQGRALSTQQTENLAQTEWLDVTLPAQPPLLGHLHPLTQTLKEVIEVAKKLGFQTAMGPEIELDSYNFEKVNMPKDAPSRDTQASFYLSQDTLLRTHTSNMQSRILEKTRPPLRVLVPGKCFRVDDVDASHNIEFWQFEGFMVDKGIRVTDLLGTVEFFLKELLPGTEVKFQGTHFDFTEPSLEAHIRCTICKGKGCPYCKNIGWSEVLGCGMIHPNVLQFAGIDPKVYTGFAFGMGLTRLAILKYQIDDIRVLTNPDLRILKQF
jgi:phenylalanyl-tRNA synthetase alpha chain